MSRGLSTEDITLLREVLDRYTPTSSTELVLRAQAGILTREEQLTICELLSAEFQAAGLQVDWEPNQRGLKLESLLDKVNRMGL